MQSTSICWKGSRKWRLENWFYWLVWFVPHQYFVITFLSENWCILVYIHVIAVCSISHSLFLQDTFHIQAGTKAGAKQRQVFLFPHCLLITKKERGGSYSTKEKLMVGGACYHSNSSHVPGWYMQ